MKAQVNVDLMPGKVFMYTSVVVVVRFRVRRVNAFFVMQGAGHFLLLLIEFCKPTPVINNEWSLSKKTGKRDGHVCIPNMYR